MEDKDKMVIGGVIGFVAGIVCSSVMDMIGISNLVSVILEKILG